MASKILTWCSRHRLLKCRHTVLLQPVANKFYEADERGEGYPSKVKLTFREQLKGISKTIGPELKKLKEEQKTKYYMDSIIPREPDDYEIPWKFDTKEKVNEWVVTADSDNNEGYSRAQFELGKNKTGIFHGYLDTRVPKDGKTHRAGYTNIRGPKNYKSFGRLISYDWSHYNTLMVRCRGDGRPYFIVIAMNRYWDLQWFDQYHYPLYTRGGPYWQETFIPFNKFYVAAKGRIQNKQENLMGQLLQIKFLGLTLADGQTGPFQLELDYMGLYYDASLNEQFSYELYETESYKIHE